MPADVRKSRHENNQCARCGKSSHRWFQCINRIIVSATGGKKRKAGRVGVADTDKEVVEPTPKKGKEFATMGTPEMRLPQRVHTPVSGVFELESEGEN